VQCHDEFDPPRRASDEQLNWEAKLEEVLADARGPNRYLLIVNERMLEQVSALKLQCPGFVEVVDMVLRAAHLSMVTRSPLSLPPLLLVGPAGVGKTHFARKLAASLGVPCDFIAGDLLTDRGTVTGLGLSWKGAKPGRIATTLIESSCASPMFIVDEIDKVSAIHPREEPVSFLHSVLERENAKCFRDEYLSFAVRADHCFWVLTANCLETLAPSILDRLLIMAIKPPDLSAMIEIGRGIYQAANQRYANWFDAEPTHDFLAALAQLDPRKASRVVEFAMGFGAKEERKALTSKDVEISVNLLKMHEEARGRVGFVAR
jgi:ATP-dependent Lon protease